MPSPKRSGKQGQQKPQKRTATAQVLNQPLVYKSRALGDIKVQELPWPQIEEGVREFVDIGFALAEANPGTDFTEMNTAVFFALLVRAGVMQKFISIMARGTQGFSDEDLNKLGLADITGLSAAFLEVNNLPLVIQNFLLLRKIAEDAGAIIPKQKSQEPTVSKKSDPTSTETASEQANS